MRAALRVFLFVCFLAGWSALETGFGTAAHRPGERASAPELSVLCRAMEVHASQEPAVTVVVFHQGDGAEREKLALLLVAHSGEVVEYQVGGPAAAWQKATVIRLKSCFGRGLLLVSPGAGGLKAGAEFRLRLI